MDARVIQFESEPQGKVATERFFENRWVRVTASPADGESEELCGVFQSMMGWRIEPGDEEFQRYARNDGVRHALFITDLKNTWCNAPGYFETVAEQIAAYRERHGIRRVVLMGLSMGMKDHLSSSASSRPSSTAFL